MTAASGSLCRPWRCSHSRWRPAAAGRSSRRSLRPRTQTAASLRLRLRREPGARPSRRHGSPRRRPTTSRCTTNCGSFTIRLATKTSPATTASFASLALEGILRPHGSSTGSAPGFMIQGGEPTAPARRPRLPTVDPRPPSTRYTFRVAAMARAPTTPRRLRQRVLRRHRRRRSAAARIAVLGRVVAALPVVRRIGQLGDPASGGEGTPTETVEIEKATVPSPSAIVLAAGASTRYGGVKQRELLPFVLEALEQTSVEEFVVVEGAHKLDVPGVRVVSCEDWDSGPGASLRCGLAALGAEVERALIVLADGPDLDPRAVDACSRATSLSWRRATTAPAATRSRSHGAPGARSPTTGAGRSSRCSSIAPT